MSVGPRCVFCVEGAARWVHWLDVENVEYAPRDIAPACVRCERLYQAGDDDALVAVRERAWEQVQPGVDYNLRIRLAACRRADLGAIPLTEWWPPGVAELVARGFTPLEDLTGDFEIASEWPEPHRRWVPETRSGWEEVWDDGRCWLVRSPWPAMSVVEVVALLWQWVSAHRHQPPRSGSGRAEDEEEQRNLVRQFLHAEESWALDFKGAH